MTKDEESILQVRRTMTAVILPVVKELAEERIAYMVKKAPNVATTMRDEANALITALAVVHGKFPEDRTLRMRRDRSMPIDAIQSDEEGARVVAELLRQEAECLVVGWLYAIGHHMVTTGLDPEDEGMDGDLFPTSFVRSHAFAWLSSAGLIALNAEEATEALRTLGTRTGVPVVLGLIRPYLDIRREERQRRRASSAS